MPIRLAFTAGDNAVGNPLHLVVLSHGDHGGDDANASAHSAGWRKYFRTGAAKGIGCTGCQLVHIGNEGDPRLFAHALELEDGFIQSRHHSTWRGDAEDYRGRLRIGSECVGNPINDALVTVSFRG